MELKKYLGDTEMCCRCSCCKFIPLQKIMGEDYSYVCPSVARYNFHHYSGGGRLNIIDAAIKRGPDYSAMILDSIKNCQLCGACGVSCNYAMNMEVNEPIQEFRIQSVKDGHTVAALDQAVSGLRSRNAMVPGDAAKRGDWAQGLNLKDFTAEPVEVIYHAGCQTSFNRDLWKLARATAGLLRKAGVDFGIGGAREICCAGRAYQMGYEEDFLVQARESMENIRKSGANVLVTGCADCYQAFKVLYEKIHLRGGLEVLHTSEYFARLLADGRLQPSKSVELTVTYHDPCRLGRLGEPWVHWEGTKIPGPAFIFDPQRPYRTGAHGVYESPRDVLRGIPGLRLNEMVRIKEYAWCCGSGGGVSEANPEYALWTAEARIDEAESTGAEALVTSCPWCEKIFDQVVRERGSSLQILDLVELLDKAV